MNDRIFIWPDRTERIGSYEVCISGNVAYVGIPRKLFFPAAFSGTIEDVLRDAHKATRKYEHYDRILLLTMDQIEVALNIRFPFERAGFPEVYVLMSETTPVSGTAVVVDLE